MNASVSESGQLSVQVCLVPGVNQTRKGVVAYRSVSEQGWPVEAVRLDGSQVAGDPTPSLGAGRLHPRVLERHSFTPAMLLSPAAPCHHVLVTYSPPGLKHTLRDTLGHTGTALAASARPGPVPRASPFPAPSYPARGEVDLLSQGDYLAETDGYVLYGFDQLNGTAVDVTSLPEYIAGVDLLQIEPGSNRVHTTG